MALPSTVRSCMNLLIGTRPKYARFVATNTNRKYVRLRHTLISADPNLNNSSSKVTLPWLTISRTTAQKAKQDEETLELSMSNAVFSEYVKSAVENKTSIPRYHAVLTAKLSDYELR